MNTPRKTDRRKITVSAALDRSLARYVIAGTSIAAALPSLARADFIGPYTVGNWTFQNNGGSTNGALQTFGLPGFIQIEGGHSFSNTPGTTDFTIAAVASGHCGMHPADRPPDSEPSRAALQQLVALGYIEKPDEDEAKAAEDAVREARFNLARSLLDARRPAEALPLLEELHSLDSKRMTITLTLANCYFSLGRLVETRHLAEMLAHDEDAGTAAIGQKQARIVPQVDLLMGLVCFAEGKTLEALAHLQRAEALEQNIRHLQQNLGRAYLKLRQFPEAENAFRRELQIDDDDPASHHGLGIALLNLRRNEEAAEHCLRAIALSHHMPLAHYHLGLALTRLGQDERAILALETSLVLKPDILNAHRLLAVLYQERDADKATLHRKMTRVANRSALVN